MSQTSVPQIYVLFFKFSNRRPNLKSMSFFNFSNRRPILKSMAISHFSNRRPMTSLMYALTLTNKSTIDLRIWKGHRFENTLKSDRYLT